MRKVIIFTAFIIFIFSSFLFSETKILQGMLSGEISGVIKISENLTKTLDGSISGTWKATINDDGSISGEASGNFGAMDDNGSYGFSGTFNVKYDPKTKKLIGTWNLPGLEDNNTIEFSVEQFTGKFAGPIKGKIPTKNGGVDFTGKITLNFSGFQTKLKGTVDAGLQIKVGWKLLNNTSTTCGEGYVTDNNGEVKGSWNVDIAPDQSISGEANGAFKGVATLSLNINNPCISSEISSIINLAGTAGFNISIPPITLSFPYYGTWMGTLQGNMASGLYFGGSWTESYNEDFYNSMGTGFENIDISQFMPENSNGKFGGSIKINIDVANGTNTNIPINGTINGGGTAVVQLKKLAQQQGICTQYTAIIQSIPANLLPACATGGDICNCLPDSVSVEWWLEDSSLNGNLNF